MIRQNFKKAVLAGLMCLSLVAGLIPSMSAKAEDTTNIRVLLNKNYTLSSLEGSVTQFSVNEFAVGGWQIDEFENVTMTHTSNIQVDGPTVSGDCISFHVTDVVETGYVNIEFDVTQMSTGSTSGNSGVAVSNERTHCTMNGTVVLQAKKEEVPPSEAPTVDPTNTTQPSASPESGTVVNPDETNPATPAPQPSQQPSPVPAPTQPAPAQQQAAPAPVETTPVVVAETQIAAVDPAPVQIQEEGVVAGTKHQKEGSTQTASEKKESQEPEVIELDLQDAKVTKETLVEYAGKNVKLEVHLGDTAKWVIDASTIDADKVVDMDLSIERDAKAIPQDTLDSMMALDQLKDATLTEQISLVHDGPFGFSADLYMLVGEDYTGKYANLFYYNPETKAMEFVAASQVGEDGYASFPFVHASDYAVIVDRAPIGDLISNSSNPVEMVDGTTEAVQSTEIDVERQEVEGGARWVGVLLALLILTAVVVVFVMVHMIYKADSTDYDQSIAGKKA